MPAVMHNSLTYSDKKVARSVVLNGNTHGATEVYTATRSGPADVITTRQVIEDGDIVVTGMTDGDDFSINIYLAKDTSRYPLELINITKANEVMDMDKFDMTSILNLFKHTPLIRWMSDINAPGLLPDGIGWDGKDTGYEREKYNTISSFLDGVDVDLLDTIRKAVMFSPSASIPIEWKDAKTITTIDDLMFETCDTAEGRFAVEWGPNGDFFHFGELEGFRSRRAYLPMTLGAEKFLLGTIKRNAYGLILQWSLYILRDE